MDRRLRRLDYRCRHRGSKEMDLLLSRFAERHLRALSAAQVDRLEALLEAPDADIFAWITGKESVPPEHDHDVMALLRNVSYGL